MSAFKGQQSDIHLSPVVFALVFKVIESLGYMMMTVVDDNVMIGLLEHFVGFGDGVVPLLVSVLVVVQHQVL